MATALSSLSLMTSAPGQTTQPLVAIHDSELTRALETMPASGATPTGANTTGFQWWTTDWHYFVMPESLEEAMRSDGTAFTVIGDSNIAAGLLLPNGAPKYPILFSLTAEAMNDNEIAPLTNYVAAGGFLVVGGSAFSRTTNGTTRGDFALASQMGVHMLANGLTNWTENSTFTRQATQPIVGDIPDGPLTWRMPSYSEEINWGISPSHVYLNPHDIWQVQVADATVLAVGDSHPYLTVKPYGKGYFIYDAAFQPIIGHGGFAPGMYAYVIVRREIEWAFQACKLPVPKLSPWPYQYDAAFMIRHDLEDFTNEIADVILSAQVEASNGVRGDYYFCTGTLRQDAGSYNSNTIIANLRLAATNYGATIGPHNGGLPNPDNSALIEADYDFWHWGPDEVLDFSPAGYANGTAYAKASVSNSFTDIETWLSGIESNTLRVWVSPNFNATRENSYELQSQLGVKIAGDQKITPFPHWTLSTETSGLRYSFLSEPVSDWFVGGLVAQSLEPWHPPGVHTTATMEAAVDYYYNLGALVNVYSHTLSTGEGDAGQLTPEYLSYSINTNLHPKLWIANAVGVYQWWLQRSNAVISVTGTNLTGDVSKTTFSIKGSENASEAVELEVPNTALISGLTVLTNNKAATGAAFRTNGQVIRVEVGTTVTNVTISYALPPVAGNDFYTTPENTALVVAAPGVLANDTTGASGGTLTPTLVTGPSHGTLVTGGTDGSFTYMPTTNFTGTDTITYRVSDGQATSQVATVAISVLAPGQLFADNFARSTNPAPIAPWTAQTGHWGITNGALVGTSDVNGYGEAWYNNTNWMDYTVQGQIQFSSTSGLGGGMGGRLNPATGAHYAAWVYPDNSAGGPLLLKLIKFEGWQDWSGTPMASASLSAVGTNAHTVALTFQGPNISISFDGSQLINATDNNFDSVAPYTNGGITLDMYTDTNPYTFTVENVIVGTQVVAQPVTANNDSYSTTEGTTLNVAVPGILANDTGGTNTLTASLVSNVTHGTLTLNANGSFTYVSAGGFTGTDSFTYKATDGGTVSTATVTITVNPTSTVLFSDNFTSSTIAPWVVEDGTWAVTNDSLLGEGAANSYANAYVTNSTWANYTLQAQVQMSSIGGYGGGIGARLNPANGAHYAAWIYPEDSAGGSAVMKLVKFEGWTTWSFTPMETASLPAVGTNWHTVTMTLQGTNIAVSFDGTPVINVNDNDFDSVAAYTNGGITADLYTDANAYGMSISNVVVSTIAVTVPPVVANNDSYVMMGGTTLTVAAPGVLGNDTGGSGSLTASLVGNVTNGTLSLNADGAFTYTPANGFSGTDGFTYQATDGNTTATATVTITVTAAGVLFSDNFTSSTNPAPLSPWVAEDGTWAVTGGRLLGESAANSYGNAYVTNSTWTDYSFQAQVQMSVTNGYGGGIGGRLNPANGAHYAAWIYPEGSAGGSGVMKLVKFEGWTTWSFTPMQTASLPSVGTNWHTVTMTFQGTNISVSFDGTPTISVTDNNFDSVAPYLNGGITADLYTDANAYGISVDNVVVSTLETTSPTITSEPASQTNNAGSTATFAVGASGTGLSYQWFFNTSAINGATSATLTLTNISASNAGPYSVTVSNSAGSVTSSPATLTVIVPPAITTQPASQTASPGGTATFTVVATGTSPVYQWKFNGTNIAGATASSFSETNVQATNAGSYTVTITNAAGSITSSAAVLTVAGSPVIVTQPASQTDNVGATATFTVTATGGSLAYQWAFNGMNIAGATASTYSKSNVQTTNAGSYTVTITNTTGSVTSSPATLTIIAPPAITTQPASESVNAGGTATFTVVATGTSPVYQWKFNGTNIAGATASSYSESNVQSANAGSYTVTVTNAAGSVTSSAAVLTVTAPPAITTQPVSQTVIAGQNASFSVTATGSAPLSYQWKFNGTNLTGATGSSYTVTNAQPAKAGSYSVAVTNASGSITSSPAVLSVNYSLTATATTGGTVSVNPNQTSFAPNSSVTVTATPAAGYVFTGWSGNASGSNNPISLTMTTNLAVTANFNLPVATIIVADTAATFTGAWSTGSATNEYGTNYRYASGAFFFASATVTFTPTIVTAGKYDVYVWYPTDSSSSASAPYLVSYSGGSASVSVNETTGTGSWQLMASARPFAKGTAGYVKISNNSGDLKRVTANAVKFVYSSTQ